MELIIFDCDGVLVDSEPISLRANVVALAELGFPATEQEILHAFVGKSNDSIRVAAAEWLGPDLVDPWLNRFRELYYAALEQEVKAVDGIFEALAGIDGLTCVASNGTMNKMRLTLGRTGLWDRFEGRIYCAADVPHGKPAPDLFLHAARQMGVPPQRCVVIEDGHHGVQAARAAGMRSFGYTGSVTPAAWLEGPGTVLFNDMRQLPELLRAL